jgi:uncharacterized protein involved in exopolysaccharide biosynthesis
LKSRIRLAWAVLRSRGALFIGVAAVCALSGLLYGLLAKDRYEAVATLFVDPSALEAGALGTGAPNARAADLDLLRSERVAQRVVENEHLVEEPLFHDLYLESIDAGKPPVEALARALAAQVDARAGGEGGLVRVGVTASEPHLAARLANAYAQAWGEVGLELRAASIRNGIERAQQELVSLRARLGAAQARTHEGADLTGAGPSANEEFAQLSRLATRPLRHAAAADATSGTRADLVPGADSAVEAALVHPESLAQALGAARAGEGAALAAPARAGPAPATSSPDEDIRLAQQSLERAEDRLARLSAEGIGAPFPVHVLLAARVPEASSKPALAVCVLIGMALGLLMGALGITLAEALDRRVRRASDIARGLGVVVLGSLPPAGRAQMDGSRRRRRETRWIDWQRADGATS